MRLHGTFIFIAFMALLIAPNNPAAEENSPLSRFNEEQLKKIEAGEPACNYELTKEGCSENSGNGQCSIIIKTPIDKCFEIMEKIDLQVHWVPNKKKSEIISKNEDKVLIENEYGFYGITVKYHSIYTVDEKRHRLEWKIDQTKPHDFEENSGFYQLEKIDEKTTLLTYGAYNLDVGFSVPNFVKNFLLGRSLPKMATNARKYIESDGKWRQDD